VVAFLDLDLNAAKAVHGAITGAFRRLGFPLLLIQHIAQNSRGQFGAVLLLWGAGIGFRVLPQPLDQADRAVDLAGDAVLGRWRLVALLEDLELGLGPLRAVVVAPGVLLLFDLVDLVAEIIDIGLLDLRSDQ
jgi:hypothetical protein